MDNNAYSVNDSSDSKIGTNPSTCSNTKPNNLITKQIQNYQTAVVDSFISSLTQPQENKKGKSFFSIPPTAQTAIILPLAGYIGKTIADISNKKFKFSKGLKEFVIVNIATAGIYAGMNYLCNFDKNLEQIKKYFNEINTNTNAKLADKQISSKVEAAFYSPISGKIYTNKLYINDPILRHKAKKTLKHELVHARQFETIARSENGIKKLNYGAMKMCVNNMYANPTGKESMKQYIDSLYAGILADTEGKYDNVIIPIKGADVNAKNYITAIHTLMNNENAGIDDIPMVINEEHYKEVCDKKGELTEEEKDSANQYYQSMLNYKNPSFIDGINPFSDYYNNPLEKEAYKENPSIYTFINRLFSK